MSRFFLFCLISVSAFSQSGKNTFSLEGVGNGVLYSVNYERLIATRDSSACWSLRIGLGTLNSDYSPGTRFVIPAEVSLIIGTGRNNFELGAGYTALLGNSIYAKDTVVLAVTDYEEAIFFRAGLRRHRIFNSRNCFARFGFTPFLYRDYYDAGRQKFQLWFGLAFGIAF
ncbi:MAG: hypothetical protein AB1458_14005 [Bacteroidota bacterium]